MMYWNHDALDDAIDVIKLEPKHMMYWNDKYFDNKKYSATTWTKTYDVLKLY